MQYRLLPPPHSPLGYLALQLTALTICVVTVACGRSAAPSPEAAFRELTPSEVYDDLDFAGLEEAITAQQAFLLKAPERTMQFGPVLLTRRAYAESLDRLVQALKGSSSTAEKGAYIKNNFRFLQLYGGESWGSILLTGYFEPIIKGSLTKSEQFTQPLYGRPDDLVTVDLKAFSTRFSEEPSLRARLDGNRVGPYFSREDIDGPRQSLAGRGLELCWVDPIDGFFLQIQGSGTVQLEDGTELHITFSDKNGLKYEPIGKFLRDRIAPKKITMQRVAQALRNLPLAERLRVMFLNASYVFFQISKQRAVTAMGVSASPGRTIASDPRYIPKGALAFLSFTKPIFDPSDRETDEPREVRHVSRLVLDQDTGGAIKGTDHIDLFCGRGDEAKQVAGVLQEKAQIVYLVPK